MSQPRFDFPLSPQPGTAFAVPHVLPRGARSEESDGYAGIVSLLNPKLRVISGACGLQWIVQRQNGKRNGAPIWGSFAYCGTKEGLLLRLPKDGLGCDLDAWAIIEALPACYPKGQLSRRPLLH